MISGVSGRMWRLTLSFSQAAVYAFCKEYEKELNKTFFGLCYSVSKMCFQYLVHDVSIGLSKGIWNVSCLGSELEAARMLAIIPLAQDLSGFLGFLHINWTNWHPSCSLDPFHVSLVHSLWAGGQLIFQKKKKKYSVEKTQEICIFLHHSASHKPF